MMVEKIVVSDGGSSDIYLDKKAPCEVTDDSILVPIHGSPWGIIHIELACHQNTLVSGGGGGGTELRLGID